MSDHENQNSNETTQRAVVEHCKEEQPSSDNEHTDLQSVTKTKRNPLKPVKPASSKKERKRTQNINAAFAELRRHIPNVPSDTKLSKIKTLKLAMSYIHHLEFQLEGEEELVATTIRGRNESTQTEPIEESTTEHDRRNSESSYEELDEASTFSGRGRSSRTGWPQHVWALELSHTGKTTASSARKTLQQVAV